MTDAQIIERSLALLMEKLAEIPPTPQVSKRRDAQKRIIETPKPTQEFGQMGITAEVDPSRSDDMVSREYLEPAMSNLAQEIRTHGWNEFRRPEFPLNDGEPVMPTAEATGENGLILVLSRYVHDNRPHMTWDVSGRYVSA